MNNHDKKKDVQLCLTFVSERRPDGVVIAESATRLVIGDYTLFSGLMLSHQGNVFWTAISESGKVDLLRQAALLAIEAEAEQTEAAKS